MACPQLPARIQSLEESLDLLDQATTLVEFNMMAVMECQMSGGDANINEVQKNSEDKQFMHRQIQSIVERANDLRDLVKIQRKQDKGR